MPVYTFHFHERFHHAQHYTGYTENFERRCTEHFNHHECGSPLVSAALEAGIGMDAVLYYSAGRDIERSIKSHKGASKTCALCGSGHYEVLEGMYLPDHNYLPSDLYFTIIKDVHLIYQLQKEGKAHATLLKQAV